MLMPLARKFHQSKKFWGESFICDRQRLNEVSPSVDVCALSIGLLLITKLLDILKHYVIVASVHSFGCGLFALCSSIYHEKKQPFLYFLWLVSVLSLFVDLHWCIYNAILSIISRRHLTLTFGCLLLKDICIDMASLVYIFES